MIDEGIHIELGSIKLEGYLTLADFAERQLASPEEWQAYIEVKNATPARPEKMWVNGECLPKPPEPNPALDRQNELRAVFSARFFEAIASGRWTVTTIRNLRRIEVEPELLHGKPISLLRSTIGPFVHIKVSPNNSVERLGRLIRFIESVCSVIPPKSGVRKTHIQDLADKEMPFDVRDDLFKLAWREATIPDGYRAPGR